MNNTKPKNTLQNNFKYNYIVEDPSGIRFLNVFAFFSFLCAIYGFVQFLALDIWYAVLFGPLFSVLFISKLSTFLINSFYPEFSVAKHQNFILDFWDKNPTKPTVDIMLPIAGESIEVLKETWEAVNNIQYPNCRVYILDDAGDNQAAELAQKFGFTYIHRPNKGEWKKSGNIKHGYESSAGEYVVIFDADFRPIPEALIESLPYIISNSEIGILQTPQYFHTDTETNKNSPIEYGAGAVIEDFYRVVMPSRARFGNAMCVGTSAIYRRKAIIESGMPLVDHTEDVRQGLLTYNQGYHVSYIPVIISQGVCPNKMDSYIKQQMRWAYGSFETIFSHYFTQAKLDNWSKFNYLTSFLYYLSEAFAPLLSIQILCLLYFNTETLRLSWAIPFVPFIFYQLVLKPKFTLNKNLSGIKIVGLAHTFIYSTALVRLLLGKKLDWEATNAQNQNNKGDVAQIVRTSSLIFTIFYIVAFLAILIVKPYILLNFETYIILAFCVYRIVNYVRFTHFQLTVDKGTIEEKVSELQKSKKIAQINT